MIGNELGLIARFLPPVRLVGGVTQREPTEIKIVVSDGDGRSSRLDRERLWESRGGGRGREGDEGREMLHDQPCGVY